MTAELPKKPDKPKPPRQVLTAEEKQVWREERLAHVSKVRSAVMACRKLDGTLAKLCQVLRTTGALNHAQRAAFDAALNGLEAAHLHVYAVRSGAKGKNAGKPGRSDA